MPLVLKRVLESHAIKQAEWGQALRQDNGRPLSATAANRLLRWNEYPRRTDARELQSQTEAFLREREVPEEEMPTLWAIDDRVAEGKRAPQGVRRTVTETDNAFDKDLPETAMLSEQTKRHYQLFRSPFLDDIRGAKDIYLSADQRYIREAMYDATRHCGFVAVVGESGAGKTVLRRELIDRLQREKQEVVAIQPQTLDKTKLNAWHICDAIIADISREQPKRTLEAKARQVQRLLSDSARAGNRHAVIIEEAHDLNTSTLKYLKRFWEMEDGFTRLLGIVLIGQPELKRTLDERINWNAREVIRRCQMIELTPLDREALKGYLELKFSRAGGDVAAVLADDAYDALIERLTMRRLRGGEPVSLVYPLTVNNAVTKAMNLAAELGAGLVTGDVIRGV